MTVETWVYIASHSKELAEELSLSMEKVGFTVCSSWHKKEFLPTEKHNVPERFSIAEEDLEDIKRCDWLVLVSGPERYSGGKFVEAGIAYGLGKKVLVRGRRENMLTYLFESFDETLLGEPK